MEENYTYIFKNHDKNALRLISLGMCILIDLISLTGIITSLAVKKYVDLIIYGAMILLVILIRILSLFLIFDIEILYDNGNVVIAKKYALKKYILYNGSPSDIKINKLDDEVLPSEIFKRLCSKRCADTVYMVELSGKKYLIELDDYMYSLIEVRSDIS